MLVPARCWNRENSSFLNLKYASWRMVLLTVECSNVPNTMEQTAFEILIAVYLILLSRSAEAALKEHSATPDEIEASWVGLSPSTSCLIIGILMFYFYKKLCIIASKIFKAT